MVRADNEKLMNIFVKAAVESASQKPFLVRHRNGEEHFINSAVHILFVFPFGSGKSSLAKKIPNAHVTLSHTEPAIVGSISKEGSVVKSDLFNAAKQVYVMDECHRLSKKAMDAMLSLLEDQYYNRSLGFSLKAPFTEGEFEKDGWQINSKGSLNSIELRVMFTGVGFCEFIPKIMGEAFLSRFSIFNIVMDEDDPFNLMRGRGLLSVDKIPSKYVEYSKPVLFDRYDEYTDEFEFLCKALDFLKVFKPTERGFVGRIGANLAKLAVHFARIEYEGKKNDQITVKPEQWRRALEFLPLMMINLKESALTPSIYKIYDACLLNKVSDDEEEIIEQKKQVAAELGVSLPYVYKIVKELEGKGFDKMCDVYKKVKEGNLNISEELKKAKLLREPEKIRSKPLIYRYTENEKSKNERNGSIPEEKSGDEVAKEIDKEERKIRRT